MIGGYLDQDMQYDEVSRQLSVHRYEKLPHLIIKDRILEQSQDNEDDSDFEE